MQQRQELLLAALKKDGGLDHLKEWPPEFAKKVVALLLEFHHIFSLEPNKIGCTDATKHIIELMKDEPFKERFHERSQNTILLASTQAVYKGLHSTVQGAVSHSQTLE